MCKSCSVTYDARIPRYLQMPNAVWVLQGGFIPDIVFEYSPPPSGKLCFVFIQLLMLIMLKCLHFKYGKAGFVFCGLLFFWFWFDFLHNRLDCSQKKQKEPKKPQPTKQALFLHVCVYNSTFPSSPCSKNCLRSP